MTLVAKCQSDQTDPLPVGPTATLCEVTEATSDTPQVAIALTDKAAGKIAELLGGQENSEDQALRVAVRGGGCSGFQYALAFDRAKDDDHIFEVDGVSVIVDKVSMQFVFGSEVDYVEGLQGAGVLLHAGVRGEALAQRVAQHLLGAGRRRLRGGGHGAEQRGNQHRGAWKDAAYHSKPVTG